MSAANIQSIQKAYADFSRGDLGGTLGALADDIQWLTPGNGAMSGERNGKDEVADFFRVLGERWDVLAFEPGEFIASGDRVVVLGRYEMRSKATLRTAASHWVMVWTFRDGKAVRFQEYTDTSALEAAEA